MKSCFFFIVWFSRESFFVIGGDSYIYGVCANAPPSTANGFFVSLDCLSLDVCFSVTLTLVSVSRGCFNKHMTFQCPIGFGEDSRFE